MSDRRTIDALGRRGRGIAIVGEVAQAHDGSLGTAHAYIDAIAEAGADAVKFQLHLPASESTRDEPWRIPFSPQDESRYAYWERTGFTETQWAGLSAHAHERDLAFVCSPFSLDAVDVAGRVGADVLKIASGEVLDPELVGACAATGRPVVLSSGMTTLAELDRAVDVARAAGAPVAVLQCTSSYPCPPEQVGLNLLEVLRSRYGCPIGLSDHSGTVFPGLAAMTLGAAILEVHVTLSRQAYGPDVTSSVTTEELALLAEGARWISAMATHPVDKDQEADSRADLRVTFSRSVVARTALPAGHVLLDEDLVNKKPGGGLPATTRRSLVGRRLTRGLRADERLGPTDVDPTLVDPTAPEPAP